MTVYQEAVTKAMFEVTRSLRRASSPLSRIPDDNQSANRHYIYYLP
jgi:hypothetical protein